MKKFIKYTSPSIRTTRFQIEDVILQASPASMGFGDAGAAGQEGDYGDESKWSF